MSALEILLHAHARGVGHTTAAVKVAEECGGILIVDSMIQKQMIRREHPKLIMYSIVELQSGAIYGHRKPIIIDHYALGSALSMHIAKLEQERQEHEKWKQCANALAAALLLCKPRKNDAKNARTRALVRYTKTIKP